MATISTLQQWLDHGILIKQCCDHACTSEIMSSSYNVSNNVRKTPEKERKKYVSIYNK
jgi:hypothetical protein